MSAGSPLAAGGDLSLADAPLIWKITDEEEFSFPVDNWSSLPAGLYVHRGGRAEATKRSRSVSDTVWDLSEGAAPNWNYISCMGTGYITLLVLFMYHIQSDSFVISNLVLFQKVIQKVVLCLKVVFVFESGFGFVFKKCFKTEIHGNVVCRLGVKRRSI
jgi:hypothetical protein